MALARKRMRFAFPDDFTELTRKLQERLADKHDKATGEGRALRSLREIRVEATPSWDAAQVRICFWFVRHSDDTDFEGKAWADWLALWLTLVPASGRFREIFGQVATLEELRASDYVDSDALELDRLSLGAEEAGRG